VQAADLGVQDSPVGFRLRAPLRRARRNPALEGVFLRVDAVFDERTLGPVQDEARSRLPRQQSGFQSDLERVVMQDQLELVVGLVRLPLASDIGGQPLRQSEQNLGLIDQMRAQIKQNPTARTALFPPSPLRARQARCGLKVFLKRSKWLSYSTSRPNTPWRTI